MLEGFQTGKLNKHLLNGIKPIFVSVGTAVDHEEVLPVLEESLKSPDTSHNVDYDDTSFRLEQRSFLNGGYQTYVISKLDGLDKATKRVSDCTALIVAGIDKTTGENISFLSHQAPPQFLDDTAKKSFLEHLAQTLAEVKERCKSGTIDAVIVGGNTWAEISTKKDSFTDVYVDSMKFLSGEIKKVLDFDPIVVNGPKRAMANSKMGDSVFYDNEHRRVCFVRPGIDHRARDFLAGEVEMEKKDRWDKALQSLNEEEEDLVNKKVTE